MKQLKIYFFGLLALALAVACEPLEDDVPSLGDRPTAEDATFVWEYDMENSNIVNFTNTSEGFILQWDFGNGSTAEGQNVSATYPLAGTYTVTLTMYARGGSASSSQEITIDQTDPTLLDIPAYNMLTGGVDALEGKTWVVDATTAGHMGVGPNDGSADSRSPVWWSAPPNDKAGLGIYDDKITFYLLDFVYEFENNGDVFVNAASAGDLGGDPAAGDQMLPYTPPADMSWSIREDGDQMFLSISKGGFFGFYTGVSEYEILSLTENELYVRYLDSKNPDLAWYHRLVPEGFIAPPPPAPTTIDEVLIDFEGEDPAFDSFGGNTYAVINNPDASGLNTSARVGETTHGAEVWGGIATSFAGPLEFGAKDAFRLKVWTPVPGIAKFKLESSADPNNFKEVDVEMTQTNTWSELIFDFSGSPSGEWDRMALFFDFGNSSANTFYFDDIEFITKPVEQATFSMEALTGNATKAWTLAPEAAALAVGPAKGSAEWWSNGADEVDGGRNCWFNDEYQFSSDGTYTYDAKGDIYAEGYMGVDSDGCTPEGDLPAAAQAWTSGTHSFSMTEATADAPATITVTGTGAFIGLPKAFNGGEYAAAPPAENASVTYEVLSYEQTANGDRLVLSIDISGDGTAFWRLTLLGQ